MAEMTEKVRLLSESDIFDVYGCQELLQRPLLADSARATVHARIYEIHGLYVSSAKARIRSEANFVGNKSIGAAPTLAEMMSMVREILADNLMKKQMMGGPVNLMGEVLRANMAAGMDMTGIDLGKYGVKQEKIEKPPDPSVNPGWFTKSPTNRVWDNPRWVEISKAYLDLEKAADANSMILAIDRLNQLQHNSFHMLIDLQSGRMLEGRSEGDAYGKHETARLNVQRVLDLCAKKESVYTFLDQLSTEIAGLLRQYRAKVHTVPADRI